MNRPVQTGAGPVDVLAVMGHSPAPWRAEPAGINGFHLLSANGNWIATIHGGYSDHDEGSDEPDTDDRDLALLIAAPALLADLREARAAVAELVEAADECQDLLSASGDAGAEPGSYGRDCYDAMMRCRAALAKFGGAA